MILLLFQKSMKKIKSVSYFKKAKILNKQEIRNTIIFSDLTSDNEWV